MITNYGNNVFFHFLFSDLSGKMFTFPQETNTAYVRLTPAITDFTSVTVCHR